MDIKRAEENFEFWKRIAGLPAGTKFPEITEEDIDEIINRIATRFKKVNVCDNGIIICSLSDYLTEAEIGKKIKEKIKINAKKKGKKNRLEFIQTMHGLMEQIYSCDTGLEGVVGKYNKGGLHVGYENKKIAPISVKYVFPWHFIAAAWKLSADKSLAGISQKMRELILESLDCEKKDVPWQLRYEQLEKYL